MNNIFVLIYCILVLPIYIIIGLMKVYSMIVSLIMMPFEKYHNDFKLPSWIEKIDDFFRELNMSLFS